MTDLTPPREIARLPRNKVGYPVPWFVAWIGSAPDFRIAGPGKLDEARRFDLCWICGGRRGCYGSFVIGPMCAVNRVSAEPPSHRECAVYAARACPFLANPGMRRRENRMPDGVTLPAGEMITRNPGVALVWTSRTWRVFRAPNGVLWNIGDPVSAEWFAHGRDATRTGVTDSIDSGMPLLREMAEQDGADAVEHLEPAASGGAAVDPLERSAGGSVMAGGGCEAVWVTQPDGDERACGAPAIRVRQFEADTLLVCAECDADLSDFDLYHAERLG